jgi:proteasome accessory factor B
MERVERLLNLLGALLDTERPLTRDDIAKRVPGYATDVVAFRRAFERDKETLRSMGVPLITELLDPTYPEAGEGYRVPQDQYALDDPGLTRSEMDALALAASSVKLSDSATAMALLKLGGESASAQQTVSLEDDERLPVLFAARSERRSVRFTYKDRDRTFDPYRLSFRNGHWYVSGFDHGHEEERTYRLDRMSKLSFASDANAFAPANDSTRSPWLPSWQMGDEPVMRAKLLVDAGHVQLTEGFIADDHVLERRPDGSAVIAFDVTNRDAFIGYVLGFLDHAEILEPQDLRDEFVQYLQEVASV